ncbi:unnamed protein product [Ectocarpus sp. 8 AP-2014]
MPSPSTSGLSGPVPPTTRKATTSSKQRRRRSGAVVALKHCCSPRTRREAPRGRISWGGWRWRVPGPGSGCCCRRTPGGPAGTGTPPSTALARRSKTLANEGGRRHPCCGCC